ncbi:MAG: hypothetical protein DI529_05330 [Chryseobacterium sp.]|nr:MAG: hypothetical protein DI529_05330 [Chryseobacterium sp.]
MAEFRISGIWTDNDGEITHYAVHTRTKNKEGGFTIGHAKKMTKNEAVNLLLENGNTAKTYLWNYTTARWNGGADVHVVKGRPLFLRTNADSTERDNLLHLIDYGWVTSSFN